MPCYDSEKQTGPRFRYAQDAPRNQSSLPTITGGPSFRATQVGRAPSAVGRSGAGGTRRSQAIKAHSAAGLPNPPENTRTPPPHRQSRSQKQPRKGEKRLDRGRWWCAGWAARGARCSRSPTSGGGRPTPGPPSATPSSPPRC